MSSAFFRCLVFLALLGSFDSMAQSPGTPPGPGGRPQIGGTVVQGRVMVKGQSKGLDFASVALLKTTDSSVVTGSLSNGGGYFSLEKVNPGSYLLQVRFWAAGLWTCRSRSLGVGALWRWGI
ncbi:MAG: hypothetical protein EBQ67_00935 [Sphingobacteriia bacterium]|nr:hypothetical protein [Sphingobacteriia bacterium]